MTPTEKAKQLTDRFYNLMPLECNVITEREGIAWEYNHWKQAKEAALVCVTEMSVLLLQQIPKDEWAESVSVDYWNEVHKEITRL